MIEYYAKGLFFTYKKERIENGLIESRKVFIQLRPHWFKKEEGLYEAIEYKTFTLLGVCCGKYTDWS